MSETQFTRADWRPGKRRRSQPRVRDWGGRKQLPAGMGPEHGIGSGKLRLCVVCGCVAMRESAACRLHGGASHAARKRPYAGSANPTWRRMRPPEPEPAPEPAPEPEA
jgi:hypothetical protein